MDSTDDKRIENNVMRHEYRILSEDEKAQMKTIKDKGLEFLTYLEENVAPSRERSLAATKIEEAVMWTVKGITK